MIDFACTHTCETGIAESPICEGETSTVKCTEEGTCDAPNLTVHRLNVAEAAPKEHNDPPIGECCSVDTPLGHPDFEIDEDTFEAPEDAEESEEEDELLIKLMKEAKSDDDDEEEELEGDDDLEGDLGLDFEAVKACPVEPEVVRV